MDTSTVYTVIAYLLVALGVAGAVLPLVPGPLLIWLGTLLWLWGNGFGQLDWLLLLVLGVLAVASWAADFLLTTALSRSGGVSWKAIGGAMLCGLLGGLLLSEVPIIGTLFGALIGALVGMFVIEYLDKRNWRAALAGVRRYVSGTMLATVVELGISLLMVAIFAMRVWL